MVWSPAATLHLHVLQRETYIVECFTNKGNSSKLRTPRDYTIVTIKTLLIYLKF